MTQNPRSVKPSQQDPEQGNEIDPRRREPIGPDGERGGIDDLDAPSNKNPGHTNPSHNTPGHVRQDQPGQHDTGEPGQGQTQSYPGIRGPKVKALEQDDAIDKKEAEKVKHSADKKTDTAEGELDPRQELGLKSVAKESESVSENHRRQEMQGQKATQFDGNPNPQGAPSSPLGPKDETPLVLEKKSLND
jgi:hypothetical protein